MKIDVQFTGDQSEIVLRLPVEEFKRPSDYEDALSIVEIFSGEFGVDPELEVPDLRSLIDDASSNKISHLVFKINGEGISY